MFYIRKMVDQRRQLCLPVWHPTGYVQLHRKNKYVFARRSTVKPGIFLCILSFWSVFNEVKFVLNRYRTIRERESEKQGTSI
jgi:hypothetical protein